ncbi:MAG TPA: M24 family metallopeptidase [Pirellulales bacterium]|nr:M24 family metallopeptidase [Pirellulales bacterium]
MLDLAAIQAELVEANLDGWLFYDFRNSNVLARRILHIRDDAVTTRRFFYWVPARGEPRKLVHRIESGTLDHLPGEKHVYARWQDLDAGLKRLVGGMKRVAMEYSPKNAIPYVSRVDAGTIEAVRAQGVEVVSSGDLVQAFEAAWSEEQWRMHLAAAERTTAAYDHAWRYIADKVSGGGSTHELDVQRAILDFFHQSGLITDHPPIVGVGPHSGDPHYEPRPGDEGLIRDGDFVLIDLWGKLVQPDAVYSDLTRVGFIGHTVPAKYEDIFQIVARARDAAIDCVKEAFAKGTPLSGWQVDRAARQVIDEAGYGANFVHRTGHSIGRETHGNGANMDDLETHDERRVMPRTCFSIEPGIYLPEFGVRSEVNVFVDASREVHVTGGPVQTSVLPIMNLVRRPS